ncbi:MAG: oligosaccharide flippase family protein [Deltaproteobacteria bacterium]
MLPEPAQILARARSLLRVARVEPFDEATAEGRSQERYRRIVLSTGASLAGTAVTTLVGLAIVPLLVSRMGKDFYGLWATVFSLTPWIALLDMGMVGGLVVAIAEANGRDDREGAAAGFSSAFFSLALAGVLASVALAAVVAFAPWESVVHLPAGLSRSSVTAGVALVGAVAALSLPLGLVTQAWTGYQKAFVATSFTAGGSLLSLALLVAAVRLGGSPFAVFAAGSLAGFVAGLASLAFLSRAMPWMRPSPRRVSRPAFRRLLGTATPLYLFQIGSLLVNQSQRPVLSASAGLGVTAEYDLLARIYVLAITLITVSSASFAPTFRESLERGDGEWMRKTFWRLVRLRMAAAAALCLGIVLGGNAVLRLWLGRQDFQFALPVWLTLAALILAAVWASPFFELLTILDRIWPQVAVVLVQGPLTVGLTWYLGSRYGVLGALLALVTPTVVVSGWVIPALAWNTVRTQEVRR